jgi:hypothetical protein
MHSAYHCTIQLFSRPTLMTYLCGSYILSFLLSSHIPTQDGFHNKDQNSPELSSHRPAIVSKFLGVFLGMFNSVLCPNHISFDCYSEPYYIIPWVSTSHLGMSIYSRCIRLSNSNSSRSILYRPPSRAHDILDLHLDSRYSRQELLRPSTTQYSSAVSTARQ